VQNIRKSYGTEKKNAGLLTAMGDHEAKRDNAIPAVTGWIRQQGIGYLEKEQKYYDVYFGKDMPDM